MRGTYPEGQDGSNYGDAATDQKSEFVTAKPAPYGPGAGGHKGCAYLMEQENPAVDPTQRLGTEGIDC